MWYFLPIFFLLLENQFSPCTSSGPHCPHGEWSHHLEIRYIQWWLQIPIVHVSKFVQSKWDLVRIYSTTLWNYFLLYGLLLQKHYMRILLHLIKEEMKLRSVVLPHHWKNILCSINLRFENKVWKYTRCSMVW